MDKTKPIEILKKSLEGDPKNVKLRLCLAQLYEENSSYNEAIDEYIKILSIEEGNKDALTGAGKNLFKIKDYESAKKHFLQLLDGESHLYLAKIFHAQGEAKKAEEYFRKSKELGYSDENLEKELFAEKTIVSELSQSNYEFDDYKPAISFNDVGGLNKLKKEIELKIIAPFQKAHLFKAYGKKAGGGILLYGPPGCGKTLIAKATAGQINATFMSLELTDVVDMWRGESEKKLHAFFEQARRLSPTVVFIDEVDALGASRSKFHSSEMKMLVNQFLVELDGVNKENSNILFIGATNTPWQLDQALRRPGRFDKAIFVSPPDFEARIEIFKLQLRDRPSKDVDITRLAKLTEGYSGADIKQIVEQCLENLIVKALEEDKVIPLTTKELEHAIKQTPSTVDEWFQTVKNYIEYSNQTGIYNDVEKYMNERKNLR